MNSHQPTVSLISLGCSKNQVDSELILSGFIEYGFEMIQEPMKADLVIVNTCGFIGPAKEESVDTILEALEVKKTKPGMKVMVSGCLYQRYPEMVKELREVDYWLTEPGQAQMEKTVKQVCADMNIGTGRKPGEPEMYRRKVLLSEPGSAFLRISQGCDRTCAFCSIPKFKGGLVSKNVEQLVGDVNWLTSKFGIHEINLVAQDLTQFGTDRGGNEFADLLFNLEHRTQAKWFRLHYIYPFGLSKPVLEFLAQSKRFARYLDIPFQHGDDQMLKIMRRGGTKKSFLEHIAQIRETVPGVALRTTMIVGHPGETEAMYENCVDFVREAKFEWMGVFPYSTEDGTAAARIPGKVHKKIKERRAADLMEHFREVREVECFGIGQVHDALVTEEAGEGMLACRTERQAVEVDGVVYVPKMDGVKPGSLVRVRIDEDEDMDFTGEIVEKIAGSSQKPMPQSLPLAL